MSENIFELIEKSKTIAIFAHINSDGDANGSVMAMKYYLDNQKKQSFVFLQRPINENYYFTGIDKVANIGSLESYDLAISLDCPNTKRFGIYEKEFLKAREKINIDHHMDDEKFAKINIVDCEKSSTCEMLYDIFKENKINITKEMATCLYTGIATDTGRFSHSNTTCTSLFAAGELINLDEDIDTLNYDLFSLVKKQEFELFKVALDSAEFYGNGKIAFVGVTQEMFSKTKSSPVDTFRIVDYIGGIEGVEIAVVMAENKVCENLVSVRSRNRNVQRVCSKFGGGGHLRASGCRIFVPFIKAKAELIAECERELERND